MGSNAGKALVLGGGGVTGIAWEIGMLTGLAEAGLDITDADLVIGTSAGSVVGVDVRAGSALADLYEHQLIPPGENEIYAKMKVALLIRYLRAMVFSSKPEVARARVGRLALQAKTESEEVRRKVIESRLTTFDWPQGRLRITSVEAATGSFTVFDAASGVRLLDAVGASCAVPGIWPPVTIDGKRYIDGGMRSAANADLASGCASVVVIAPLAHGFGALESLAKQAARLTAEGSKVTVITPSKAARQAIGRNVLDPARRPGAARAGHDQAAAEVAAVRAVWL